MITNSGTIYSTHITQWLLTLPYNFWLSAIFYCHSMLTLLAPRRDLPTGAGGGDASSVRAALIHTLNLTCGSSQWATTVTFKVFYAFLVTKMPSFLSNCHCRTPHAFKALSVCMSKLWHFRDFPAGKIQGICHQPNVYLRNSTPQVSDTRAIWYYFMWGVMMNEARNHFGNLVKFHI